MRMLPKSNRTTPSAKPSQNDALLSVNLELARLILTDATDADTVGLDESSYTKLRIAYRLCLLLLQNLRLIYRIL